MLEPWLSKSASEYRNGSSLADTVMRAMSGCAGVLLCISFNNLLPASLWGNFNMVLESVLVVDITASVLKLWKLRTSPLGAKWEDDNDDLWEGSHR